MSVRTCAAAVVICLAFAAPAAADERMISEGPAEGVEAGGGWLAWHDAGRFTLWRDGVSMPWDGPFVQGLGTRRDGRSVALFETCGDRAIDCSVHDIRLPHGPRRKLIDPPYEPRSFDESHGTLLLTLRGPGHPRRIFLKRPGQPLRQIGDLRAGSVSLSTGAMTNFVGLNSRYRLFAANRGPPRRWHQLASWDEAGEFRQEPGTYRAIGNVSTDGSYAYWTESRSTYDEHGYVHATRHVRILRVDTGERPQVEAFTPVRRVHSFAVTRGRLYYTDRGGGAVYEYRDPPFEPTGESLPIQG
jgi:hypothetical protein